MKNSVLQETYSDFNNDHIAEGITINKAIYTINLVGFLKSYHNLLI